MADSFQMRMIFSIAAVVILFFTPLEGRAEVDLVEVVGVTLFESGVVEGMIEVSSGERLDRTKVVRTAENLQAFYRLHGYEEVSIRSRLLRRDGESVLEFQVIEGKPTRVTSARIVLESTYEHSRTKYWGRIDNMLASWSGFASGSVLDQENIVAGKRKLLEFLASEQFVGARVDDVRVLPAEVPFGQSQDSAARWVNLEFRVDPGERVIFGFRGNRAIPASRLAAMIDEQRLLGLGRDYLRTIRASIEEEYRSIGYAQVKVTEYVFERPDKLERHVSFRIDEGSRVTVDSVDFDGNRAFSSDELREQFFSRGSDLVKHHYFSEKDVGKAAELVVEWIKSKGYLAAKLVTVNVVYPMRVRKKKQGSFARLLIYLYEGEQTDVGTVDFKGLTVFSREEVLRLLGVHEGALLNLFSFSEGIEAVKAAYRARGYVGAKILNEGTERVVRYSRDNKVADITLEFNEGPLYRASRILVEGLQGTEENVVRRELLFGENDTLEEFKILETEARLRRLGIFSIVTVRALDDPERSDGKIVKISVQEGTSGFIAGGVGFRNDLGARVFGQVGRSNVWGRNHTASLALNVNRRFQDFRFVEYQAQLGYLWPWFANDQITFRPSFTVTGQQYAKFDASTISFAATWERKLLRIPDLTGMLTYSLERVRQDNATFEIDNGDFRIGAIIPGFRIDTRDDALSPSTGWYSVFTMEIADRFLFSQGWSLGPTGEVLQSPIGYYRLQARVDRFVRFSPGVSLYLSGRLGFERNNEDVPRDADGNPLPNGPTIPLIKQFALGGAGSLRGFSEQELNVQDRGISGTSSYVNYRAQLDFPFAGALRFGPFLDAANLRVDSFSFGDLRYGAGLGFHYQTPMGPVNLDWGFKIKPRPGEDEYRFYFSIGVI